MQPPTAPLLIADRLRFSYGSRLAVDDVSIDVAPGEVVGLLGPNGAGKSTAIKIMIGLLTPSAGTVTIAGLDMQRQRSAIQARIGVVFEEKNLYQALTGRENLAFFARLFGDVVHVGNLLERVGLTGRGDDRVSTYSKGMRQRLTVARALLNQPDVLFLDEPTDGLDPVSARSVRSIIRDEVARGAAVLITTHDMYEADELCDRVAFINDGKILALDHPEALKLSHGQRNVRVRFRDADNHVAEQSCSLDNTAALTDMLSGRDIVTIHTEEATLEDVFVDLAGRRLA